MNWRENIRADTPDAVPIAWYNPRTNQSSLIASSWLDLHASVAPGMSLDNLTHDCSRVLFNSTYDKTPSSYANFQVSSLCNNRPMLIGPC
jgi:hypothetical protein